MAERFASFLDNDWKVLSKKFYDFTPIRQKQLKEVMAQCGKDFDLEAGFDKEHENFTYFAHCVRNNVIAHPGLNASRCIK